MTRKRRRTESIPSRRRIVDSRFPQLEPFKQSTVESVRQLALLLAADFGKFRCKNRVLLSVIKHVRMVWGYLVASGRKYAIRDDGSDLIAERLAATLPADGAEYIAASAPCYSASSVHSLTYAEAPAGGFEPIDLAYIQSLHDPTRWGTKAAHMRNFAEALEAGELAGDIGKYVLVTPDAISQAFDNQHGATDACLQGGATIVRVGRYPTSALSSYKPVNSLAIVSARPGGKLSEAAADLALRYMTRTGKWLVEASVQVGTVQHAQGGPVGDHDQGRDLVANRAEPERRTLRGTVQCSQLSA